MPESRSPATSAAVPEIGDVLDIRVDNPVAGGLCIGRHDGQVTFVRGALPGEDVRVRVIGHGRGGAFLRAEVEEVLNASPLRVLPPCPVASECGGCDWQHSTLVGQREIKAAVIVDALRRTGGVNTIGGQELADAVKVEALDDGNGLGWRTRMRYATDDHGVLGLRAHNSHQVIPAANCPLATDQIRGAVAAEATWPPEAEIVAASSSEGDLFVSGIVEPATIREQVRDRTWDIPPNAFWQVHPQAAETLTESVLAMADPRPGDALLDLYSGAGLFAAFIAEAVGVTGRVDAVEGSRSAVSAAKANLTDLNNVHHHCSDVGKWLRHSKRRPVDTVVLDPPRAGAGRDIVKAIAGRAPHRIVYVACDPVALARDVKTFSGLGFDLVELRAFDIFPMTKHVECVALLTRRT